MIDAAVTTSQPYHHMLRRILADARALLVGEPTSAPPTLSSPVVAAIRQHSLAPLAFRLGHQQFQDDYITSSLIAELRERDLAETIAALSAASIPVILLKGVSYAGTLYPDPALRPMSDIDVMVPSDAFAQARRVLFRLGYWDAGSAVSRAPRHHAVTLKRRAGSVDLHQRMIHPWRARIDERALWGQATPAAERTDGALRLSPSDEALIHLVHIGRHELMVPAISYLDAALLLSRLSPAETASLHRTAKKFHIYQLIQSSEQMSRDLTSPHGVPSRRPARARLLPTPAEVLDAAPVWRPLQIARKAALCDTPRELAGLFAMALYERLLHSTTRNPAR